MYQTNMQNGCGPGMGGAGAAGGGARFPAGGAGVGGVGPVGGLGGGYGGARGGFVGGAGGVGVARPTPYPTVGGGAVGGGGMVAGSGVGVATDTGCTTGCMAGGASCGEGCVVSSGNGMMTFVGPGQGQYVTETTFRYVGAGGNIAMVQPRTVLWGRVACMILAPFVLLAIILLMRPGTETTSKQNLGVTEPPIIEPPIIETTAAPQATAPPTQPPAPEVGECTFWGDPHVKSFDGARPSFYGNGEQWIVKSKLISIQGRYMGTKYTKGLAATNKIAVGGAFLKGHIIVIPTLDDGPITIDHIPKLQDFGMERIEDLAQINYSPHGELVDQATSIWEKHIVQMELPLGVRLTVLRWKNYLDLRLVMPQQPDQDGGCGNFNGDASDDTTAAIYGRVGARVEHGMLLFNKRVDETLTSEEDKLIDLCPRDRYEEALKKCPDELENFRHGPSTTMTRVCVLDLCYGANEHTLRTAKAMGL